MDIEFFLIQEDGPLLEPLAPSIGSLAGEVADKLPQFLSLQGAVDPAVRHAPEDAVLFLHTKSGGTNLPGQGIVLVIPTHQSPFLFLGKLLRCQSGLDVPGVGSKFSACQFLRFFFQLSPFISAVSFRRDGEIEFQLYGIRLADLEGIVFRIEGGMLPCVPIHQKPPGGIHFGKGPLGTIVHR